MALAADRENQHDAIAAVELAVAEASSILPEGIRLVEYLSDPDTGDAVPFTLVTDNDGPLCSARFASLIENTPELDHLHTRVRMPGQFGSGNGRSSR